MVNEDLIKNYQKERFNIEMEIYREEDALTKYQIKKDTDSVNACRERLAHLYNEIKRIDDKINELKNPSPSNLNAPIPAPGKLPDIENINGAPVDNGTTTVTFSASSQTTGSTGNLNMTTEQTQTIVKTTEYQDGEIVSEIITESSTTVSETKKDDKIDVKSRLIN